jgi:hypothetical protein
VHVKSFEAAVQNLPLATLCCILLPVLNVYLSCFGAKVVLVALQSCGERFHKTSPGVRLI